MLTPVSLFLRCALVWIILTIIAPFGFTFQYDIYPALLILLVAAAFIAGCAVSLLVGGKECSEAERGRLHGWISEPAFRKLFWVVLVIALVGCSLRFYDRFIQRDLLSAANFTEARLNLIEMGESGSGLAVVAALMFPWVYPVFLMAKMGWSRLTLAEKMLAGLAAAYPIIDGFAQGGITGSVTTLIYYYFVVRAVDHVVVGKKSFKLGGKGLVLAVLMLAAASAVFLGRVSDMFGDVTDYLRMAEAAGYIKYAETTYQIVEHLGVLGFVLVWLAHYFTLGVHEFFYLVQNFDPEKFFGGQYQMYIIIKFLRMMGVFEGVHATEFYEANPMAGHYQTFWGPAYMDFGPFIVLEAFFIGLASGVLHRMCKGGSIVGLGVYPYVQMSIILGFLASGIVGERLYYLVSLIMFAILASVVLSAAQRKDHSNHECELPPNRDNAEVT